MNVKSLNINEMKNILKYLSLALLPASLCMACADDELPVLEDAILMNSIEISMPEEVRVKLYVDKTESVCYPMLVGEALQLEYMTDPEPSQVTFPGVEWSSSNPDVVSVAADGVITAVSAGSAIITVQPDTPNIQATSSMKVTVSETLVPAASITITDNAVMADAAGVPSCYMGETMQLTASIEPAETTYRSVKWSSADESVATVDMISGLVTGVSRGYVDIIATALDPEQPATASHRIYIDEIVTPLGLRLTNAPAADATFPVEMKRYTLEFDTYPSFSTRSLIEWSSSDEAIATVEGGVVRFNGCGRVTITATCPEGELPADAAGFAKSASATFDIPEGLIREYFLDLSNLTWNHAGQSGNGTKTSSVVKQTAAGETYMEVTTYNQNATNQRGDFKHIGNVKIHAGKYPIVTIRMTDVRDAYEEITSCNLNLDTSGDGYSGNVGGNNNKYLKRYKCSDGSTVFIYDLSQQTFANGGLIKTDAAVEFRTFQFKYADMRTIDHQITYNVYWVETFASEDALKARMAGLEAQYGITYEETK